MLSSSTFMNKGRKSAADKATKPGVPADVNLDYQGVDLQLPPELTPLTTEDFQSSFGWRPSPSQRLVDSLGDSLGHGLTYGIGSCQLDDEVYFRHDTGLFQCIMEAWMNHWNLRTTPEDWWFQVTCTIAKAVVKVVQEGPRDVDIAAVRTLFLPEHRHNQAERATIWVEIPVETIDQVDHERFFENVTEQLHDNIRCPEYVEAMQNDFSTSQLTHKIASQINIMSSLQEFFEYEMYVAGCGLRGVEMAGEQGDWDRLVEKLRTLRELLRPIESSYFLKAEWWDHAEMVFMNLALTKREPKNPSVIKFWSGILLNSEDWADTYVMYRKYPRTHQVPAYDGWLVRLLTNQSFMKVKELQNSWFQRKYLSGLNGVPLLVAMTWPTIPSLEETELKAGIMGFKLVAPSATFNGVPSLQPFHMWAMMIAPDSMLRGPHLLSEEGEPQEEAAPE